MAGELIITPAILLGLVVTLIELGFVHSDERGLGWLRHGVHAIPFTVFFTFCTMNVPWLLGKFSPSVSDNPVAEVIIISIIGIVAMVKIATAVAIAGHTSIGEKKIHIFIIGLLIVSAPYVWKYGLSATLDPLIPWS